MDYKPGQFFLGVVDFLAVLVPGAVLVFALTPWADWLFAAGGLFPLLADTATRWAAFLVVAYVAGHLVASAASSPLDCLYDRTYRNLQRLREKNPKVSWLAKLLGLPVIPSLANLREAWKLKDKDAFDALLDAARRLRAKQDLALGCNSEGLAEEDLLMWAQSAVSLRSGRAATQIERYQANSKFFRSMTVVLFLLMVLAPFRGAPAGAVVGYVLGLFILLLLFCCRFMQLRWGTTRRIYEYFLLVALAKEPTEGRKSRGSRLS